MKVIVITGKKKGQKTRLMLELLDKGAIKQVKELVRTLRLSEAISSVLSKGKFIKELTEEEVTRHPSDLILTNSNTYWNLL